MNPYRPPRESVQRRISPGAKQRKRDRRDAIATYVVLQLAWIIPIAIGILGSSF